MPEGLTDAELVLLGLVAEQPRHGYEMETVIADRGVREWTALGFSSIYYVLNKLERRGLVRSERAGGKTGSSGKGRRTYTLTCAGRVACAEGTVAALERVPPAHNPVLVGMANSPLLAPGQLAESLRRRRNDAAVRIESAQAARAAQEPLELFVAAIFDYEIAMMQAEVAWIETTLLTMKAGTMATYDIKEERKDLYSPTSGAFQLVEVPPMHFLMVDGHGDPNTAPAYRDAVEALYAASYAVRAVAKSKLAKVHTVSPLEGLWSAKDLDVFQSRDKAAWDWTMMISQPEWITDGLVAEALAVAAKKRPSVLDLIRFERYSEGRSVQIFHRGPYDDEALTLERLHREYLPNTDSLRPGAITRSTSPTPERPSRHASKRSCVNQSADERALSGSAEKGRHCGVPRTDR